MKLVPKYSYEFNWALNHTFDDKSQIQNFSSLLTDKERFFGLVPAISLNEELLEKLLGYDLPERLEFYVVRAEKFKSFSEPVTIEYSLVPEEMVLFLLKEIIKISATDRFVTEVQREEVVNAFILHLGDIGNWGPFDFDKLAPALHNESERMYPDYSYKDIDFSKKTLKEYILGLHEE